MALRLRGKASGKRRLILGVVRSCGWPQSFRSWPLARSIRRRRWPLRQRRRRSTGDRRCSPSLSTSSVLTGQPRNRSRSSCTYRRTEVCIGTIGGRPRHKKGYFLFRAGVDGEYWFDVRTRDRSGQVRPQGPHAPKLIVIVDTVPPKVQLTAVRGEAGQITAAFRIEELYPKLDSLAIEYRLAPTAAWQTVPVGPKDVRSNNAEHTGEVTWYPQNASGTMEIRLRVNDLAGNPAESHTHRPVRRQRNAQSHATAVGEPSRQFRPERTRLVRRRRSRLRQRRPQLHLLRQRHRLARSCRQGGRIRGNRWARRRAERLGRRRTPVRPPLTRQSRPRRRTIPATARLPSVSIRRSRSNLLPTASRHRPRRPPHRRPRRTRSTGSPPAARAGLRRFRRPPATSARRRACNFAGSIRGFSNSPTTPAPWAARATSPSNCGERATAASHGRALARIPRARARCW